MITRSRRRQRISRICTPFAGAAFACLAAAVPAHAVEELPQKLAALSPAEFADSVEVIDDLLEPDLVVSTQDVYSKSRSLDGARAQDVYILARIARSEGDVSYHVVHDLAYWAPRRSFTHVQFLDGSDLVLRDVAIGETGQEYCDVDTAIGECRVFQTLSFELSAEEMRRLSESYAAGSREPWRLRFKDEHGQDVTSGLAPAEASGLMQAVLQLRKEAS
ncbi:hypothetical protein [Croceicoccus gelatinilyticus]|uniref:hypothetical protein n=1 Tax=Croceicoccus gelatinilyticus TaxID=2835536 RepID=UPI001BCD3416|nr:hypothetical protein [Croceicoccus gelatinilyticus]MBS7668699.1 hypothetical protein [Croceicoccus gelatinilyticus]